MKNKKLNKNDFEKNLPNNWLKIFQTEYEKFWHFFNLYWFFEWNNLIWWFCLWYNPDYFKNKVDNIIIDNLNKNKYKKISYFYMNDNYKWEKKWWKLLKKFMEDAWWKYFLTCSNNNLKKYYISLGFELVNKNEEKFILIFEK